MNTEYIKALAEVLATEAVTSIREAGVTPSELDLQELSYQFTLYVEAKLE